MSYTTSYKTKYKETVVPAMKEKFQYKSVMQVPVIKKICLNQGLGDAVSDKKIIETALNEMTAIAGQKAVATKSKKDISNFKLRKGVAIGARVTLRGDRMYEFLERLVSVALPRVRDFNGLNNKGFDGRGNYNFGITEQIIFAELNIDKITKMNGMDISIVTTAKTDEECLELLRVFGMPIKQN